MLSVISNIRCRLRPQIRKIHSHFKIIQNQLPLFTHEHLFVKTVTQKRVWECYKIGWGVTFALTSGGIMTTRVLMSNYIAQSKKMDNADKLDQCIVAGASGLMCGVVIGSMYAYLHPIIIPYALYTHFNAIPKTIKTCDYLNGSYHKQLIKINTHHIMLHIIPELIGKTNRAFYSFEHPTDRDRHDALIYILKKFGVIL